MHKLGNDAMALGSRVDQGGVARAAFGEPAGHRLRPKPRALALTGHGDDCQCRRPALVRSLVFRWLPATRLLMPGAQ
jgi:hypothetical protein